jgi:hypothetical protein
LHKTIKTANTKKKWKGIPANALCFGQAGAVLSLSKDGQPVPMSEASSGAKVTKKPCLRSKPTTVASSQL